MPIVITPVQIMSPDYIQSTPDTLIPHALPTSSIDRRLLMKKLKRHFANGADGQSTFKVEVRHLSLTKPPHSVVMTNC